MWVVTLNFNFSPSSVRPRALNVEVALNELELPFSPNHVVNLPVAVDKAGSSGSNENVPVCVPVR